MGGFEWSNGVWAELALGVNPNDVMQRHRFTADAEWQWPYGELERAVMVIRGDDASVVKGILVLSNDQMRDESLDISFEAGSWQGAISDGTTLWFIDGGIVNIARAYVAATRTRDSSKDISLGIGNWSGGVSDGITLWFIDHTADTARAYVAATQARDSSKDISLGAGVWAAGVSDGITLWFVDDTANIAEAYVAATQARDSSKDISLGAGVWNGGVSDGITLWFVDDTANIAEAYVAATQARDSSKDISLGAGTWLGAASNGTTLWFLNNDVPDTAEAYGLIASDPPQMVFMSEISYTNIGADDDVLVMPLTDLEEGDEFRFYIEDGMVDIYPQL